MSSDHGALCKFNAAFRAAGLVSFAGLPPNSWYSVSERNAELRLIRENNSTPPLSNCPVPLLRDPSQSLLALLKIPGRPHSWYAFGVAHFLYSVIACRSWCRHTFSIPLLGNSSAVLKSVRAHQFRQLPVVPLGGNKFVTTFLVSRWLALQTLAHMLTADREQPTCLEISPFRLSSCEDCLHHRLLLTCCSHAKSKDLPIHFVDTVWLTVFAPTFIASHLTSLEENILILWTERHSHTYLITFFDVHCRHRWMLLEVTLKHFVYWLQMLHFCVKNVNAKKY